MSFFLAMDVGGTKTDYVLADATHTLARVRTGSIKRMRSDAEVATAYLEEGLAQLSAQTGIAMRTITRTCVGTAGNTVPLVTDWLRTEIGARVSGELQVVGDVTIALDAAFPGSPGIVVIAGTGSNVAGRTEDRHVITVGGWGPALADQGSGHRIGEQAVRAITWAYDAGRGNLLYEEILRSWGLGSFDEFVEFANRRPAPDFSQLVRSIVRSADAGDALAQEVLRNQGVELGVLIKLLIARLRTHAGSPKFLPPLAFTGSIMESVPAVRNALLDCVRQDYPRAEEVPGVVDPVLGALWRARTAYGFA